jgi:hypothetical protein
LSASGFVSPTIAATELEARRLEMDGVGCELTDNGLSANQTGGGRRSRARHQQGACANKGAASVVIAA